MSPFSSIFLFLIIKYSIDSSELVSNNSVSLTFPAASNSLGRRMAHPSCQLAANSPKKTPQTTPSKTAPASDAEAESSATQVATEETGTPVGSIPIPRIPVLQRFGCLRVYRLSSLLLSMHCWTQKLVIQMQYKNVSRYPTLEFLCTQYSWRSLEAYNFMQDLVNCEAMLVGFGRYINIYADCMDSHWAHRMVCCLKITLYKLSTRQAGSNFLGREVQCVHDLQIKYCISYI